MFRRYSVKSSRVNGIPLIAGGAYDPRLFTHVGTREFTSGVSFAEYERVAAG